MPVPQPDSESIRLANEAFELPPHAVERRRQLVWRLSYLVRTDATDVPARTGLVVSLLSDGERVDAEDHVDTLYGQRYLGTDALYKNLLRALIIVGHIGRARVVAAELLSMFDLREDPDPRQIAGWVLASGDLDLIRQADELLGHEDRMLRLLDQHCISSALPVVAEAAAETVGRESCEFSLFIEDDDYGNPRTLFFDYRVPAPLEKRLEIQRHYRRVLKVKLAENGFSYSDILPFIVVMIGGMSEELTEAA